MSYLKPQSPLSKGSDFIYPLTTADQIIVGENGARLNTKYITVDLNQALENENAATINADLFDGKPSSAYVLQEDLIKTVNNIEPDANGNINLTAADVNARSNTWIPNTSDLALIQKGSWNGDTASPDLPLGITYVASDATGTNAGFPGGYTTILNIKHSNDRCFQIATQKFDGTTWIRSPLANVSDGWCPWQKLLDNTDITIKNIITDLSKTTAAPVNHGTEARAGVTGILPLTSGGTGMEVSSIPQLISSFNIFPIGSFYTTSTNVNPGAWLGGTWELYKKHFSNFHLIQTVESDNKIINFNSTNVTDHGATEIYRSGDSIHITLDFIHNAAWADSDVDIGTVNFNNLGITQFPIGHYELAIGDGANNAAMVLIAADGTIKSNDTIPDSLKVADGYNLVGNYHWIIPDEFKLDDACDEFIWKRVS